MKKYVLCSLFALIFNISNAQIWIVDPLESIYPDKNKINLFTNNLILDFAKNTPITVNVLVKIPKNEEFKITAYANGNMLSNSAWSILLPVPVEQNTGIDSRTEAYLNKKNPYVIRRAPFNIFEIIQPIKKNTFKSKTNYTAFQLKVPKELTSTKNKINVRIKVAGKKNFKGMFTAKIHPITIPTPKQSNFFYTNWFNLKSMEQYHNIKRWSKNWYKMLEKYAEIMAYGRQNSIIIPQELIKYENDQFILEEDKLLQFINIFKSKGFKYFEAPHIMFRGKNDAWGDPELKVVLTGRRYYKENGKQDVENLMQLIKKFTIKHNLQNGWLQHISDEPTSVQAQCYKDISKQIKAIFPQVKIMEATNDKENIAGAVDIWCPIIDDFQKNESFFRDRVDKGEQVLVYTCLIPGGKWLNRTLDMEKLRQVYFGWGASHYNTSGYLHWGLNQYYSNPMLKSVVPHPSPSAGTNNFLPAGDTHIIYPGINEPLSSLRFEAHRIGIEDYELLELLKENELEKYNELKKQLFRSYTDYNLNISDYRKVKAKLLKSLRN